jgi:hypothetical protein
MNEIIVIYSFTSGNNMLKKEVQKAVQSSAVSSAALTQSRMENLITQLKVIALQEEIVAME